MARWGMYVLADVTGRAIEGWLQAYDLDAVDPRHFAGGGTFTFTTNPRQALAFESAGHVLTLWKQQATTLPARPDGRPNRPLTQFTITPRLLP